MHNVCKKIPSTVDIGKKLEKIKNKRKKLVDMT